ncbi:MAG: hypothetical protein AAGE01_08810 [Pseudomonadota bacterium]
MSEPMRRAVADARVSFFDQPDTDVLMTAVLELMSELWVNRQQQETLRAAMIEKGVVTADELDAIAARIDDDTMEAQRGRFIRRVLRALDHELKPREEAVRAIDESA